MVTIELTKSMSIDCYWIIEFFTSLNIFCKENLFE